PGRSAGTRCDSPVDNPSRDRTRRHPGSSRINVKSPASLAPCSGVIPEPWRSRHLTGLASIGAGATKADDHKAWSSLGTVREAFSDEVKCRSRLVVVRGPP